MPRIVPPSSHATIAASRRSLLTGGAKLAGAAGLAGIAGGGFNALRPNAAAAQDAAGATPTVGGAQVDPQMQAVLDALASFDAPPLATVDPQVGRNLPGFNDAVMQVLTEQGKPPLEAVGDIDHVLIPGPAGQILGRIYKPADAGDGPLPVLVYFHGGGFVIANLGTYDASGRALANAAGCLVVSIAYRQAPENPFPAAVDDAYAATQYLLTRAGEIGGDAQRVAVGGESAGGNLATVVCLRARDEGGALPVHQLLVYPVATFAPDAAASESIERFADAKPLDAPSLEWFGRYYLPDPSAATNPYASPLLATDLSGLPPATVIAAEIDPLQSQGKLYADALEAAGVDTTYTRYEGVTHEFFGMGAVVDKAKEAEAEAGDALKAAFAAGAGTPTS